MASVRANLLKIRCVIVCKTLLSTQLGRLKFFWQKTCDFQKGEIK